MKMARLNGRVGLQGSDSRVRCSTNAANLHAWLDEDVTVREICEKRFDRAESDVKY